MLNLSSWFKWKTENHFAIFRRASSEQLKFPKKKTNFACGFSCVNCMTANRMYMTVFLGENRTRFMVGILCSVAKMYYPKLVNRELHQWLNQQLNFICALVRHRMCNFSHFIAAYIRFQPNAAFRLKISNVLHCASTKANIWTALKRYSECDTSASVTTLLVFHCYNCRQWQAACTLYICTYWDSAHPFSSHPWIRERLQMLKISLFHLLNTRYDNNM